MSITATTRVRRPARSETRAPERTRSVLAWPGFEGPAAGSYTAHLYGALAARGVTVTDLTLTRLFRRRDDVVHVHWPEYVLPDGTDLSQAARAVLLLVGLWWSRLRGATVVWTVHNVTPHERRGRGRLARWYWRLFTRSVSGFIALSRSGVPVIRERFPALGAKPFAVVPLGHYRESYPDTIGREAARARLGISDSAPVYAYFGRIRAYKNVPALIEAFRALPEDDGVLLVVGSVDEPGAAEPVRSAAEGDPRVRLHLEFVPHDEVQLYLKAADVVVLPFAEVFNSGSALLALGFARRVLLPDTPTFRELRAVVGAEWVHLFDGTLRPDDLRAACDAPAPDGPPSLAPFEWRTIAEATARFYRKLS